jgi:hypothetical protein
MKFKITKNQNPLPHRVGDIHIYVEKKLYKK